MNEEDKLTNKKKGGMPSIYSYKKTAERGGWKPLKMEMKSSLKEDRGDTR
jgi:hypothetical protein